MPSGPFTLTKAAASSSSFGVHEHDAPLQRGMPVQVDEALGRRCPGRRAPCRETRPGWASRGSGPRRAGVPKFPRTSSGVMSWPGGNTERISASRVSNSGPSKGIGIAKPKPRGSVAISSLASTRIMIGRWPGFASDQAFTTPRHSTKNWQVVSQSRSWMCSTLVPGGIQLRDPRDRGSKPSRNQEAHRIGVEPAVGVGEDVQLDLAHAQLAELLVQRAVGVLELGPPCRRTAGRGRSATGPAPRGSCCGCRAPAPGSGARNGRRSEARPARPCARSGC